MSGCMHGTFKARVDVQCFEDTGGFMADVRIECAQCGRPMQFLGLPLGVNLAGATMSADGQEARLAIAPVGRVLHPLEGVRGFGVKLS